MNDLVEKLVSKHERIANLYDIGPVQRAEVMDFVEEIVRECIHSIETYRIPVGNSAAGEMACEWTYAALKEIRDEIKDRFGVH